MPLKKRDWLFLAVVAAVFGIFFAISGEETTLRVPDDDTHARFSAMAEADGKKATEKFCKECHTEFSAQHPPPLRCLFCHKFTR